MWLGRETGPGALLRRAESQTVAAIVQAAGQRNVVEGVVGRVRRLDAERPLLQLPTTDCLLAQCEDALRF